MFFGRWSSFALVATAFLPAAASAAGAWSIGASYGGGSYSNESFNRSIRELGFSDIRTGSEFGASVRGAVARRWSIELEVTRMSGSATIEPSFVASGIRPRDFPPPASDVSQPRALHTEATAVPLNVIFGVADGSAASLRVFAGGGFMTGARWRIENEGGPEQVSREVTRPYAQAGLESAWRVHSGFELTARALGRLAQANHVPADDGGGSEQIIDHTGFALSLGARFSPGR